MVFSINNYPAPLEINLKSKQGVSTDRLSTNVLSEICLQVENQTTTMS